MVVLVFYILGAFLLGALPSGYLVGRCYGVDIRTEGSGNIGATNTARMLGKRAGIITLGFDMIKGALAAGLPSILPEIAIEPRYLPAVCGLSAILGHCYSPFMKFKGGKGVAASAGVFWVLAPLALLASLMVFILVYLATKFVSAASMASAVALPIGVYLGVGGPYEQSVLTISLLTAVLILVNHSENIARLRKGAELRLGK